ncbi:hypothetical protein KSI01_19400 [Kurthia sibirica]|nr:hypothetical protein KSI01_19400 [Kurthia sibirica]
MLLFSLLYLVEKQWGNPLQFMPQKVNEIVHDKRFNVNDATTFEEGQVQKVEKLSQSEAIALTVRMEQPQAMYLKGFIGSSFNRNEWRALSNEKALAVDSYFYWLEKGRFTSNTMLSQLQKAQGKVEQSNVVIHLDHAMTKYAYVPYELNSFQKSTNLNLDGLTYNEKLFSKKDYTYGIQTGSLQNYALSAAKLKEKNKEIESYLKLEGNYRKVVYENYLDVSKENEEVVADDFLHKKDLSYEEAIEYVQKKLDEKMTYKKAVELKEDDVVSAIWQTERSGFSTHYATIGTLAFRMMGIPARYVEGYLVTPQLVEEKKAYEEIKVREKNAHAWTEIYIDQIGWVPIEVTTPFIQIMPKIKVAYTPESEAGHSTSQSNDAQSNMASASNHKTQIEERPEILSPQPKKEKETIKWQVVSIILLLFIVLVIGVILLLKLRKRRKVIRLLWQQVTSENEKESIVASIQLVHYWFENIMGINCMNQPLHEQLNQLNGELSEETLKLYEESFIAYQALRYGGIATKKTTLVEEVKKEVIDSKKWLQKVTLKWWKGYY